MIALHFGAGALGRGLIVPFLVSAGYSVTLVDADVQLIAALERDGGYPLLEVRDDDAPPRQRFVPIRGARSLADTDGVRAAVDQADLVTTAVRVENLPSVAAWMRVGLAHRHAPATVIACENAYRASRLLAAHVGPSESTSFLDAVVDRICQNEWPVSTLVRAEQYAEWAVEASDNDEVPSSAARVGAFDAYFDRKRYLVNTTADALAFLGNRAGYRYLHEAASDDDLLTFCQPGFAELRSLLRTTYAWSEADLAAYHARALKRLARPELARALDTVARDGSRKLDAEERFAAPALALLEAGTAPVGMAQLIGAISQNLGISGDDLKERWATHPRGEGLAALVERSNA